MVFTKEWYKQNKHPKGMLGKKHSVKTKKIMSIKGSNKKLTEEWKKKIGLSHIGKTRSEETKQKISKTKKYNFSIGKTKPRYGKDNNLWNGGKSSENKILRNRKEYVEWRDKVFKRDNWTCRNCNKTHLYLEAHHIIPIAVNPEKIYDVDNGLTLCLDCHKKTESYLNNKIGVKK